MRFHGMKYSEEGAQQPARTPVPSKQRTSMAHLSGNGSCLVVRLCSVWIIVLPKAPVVIKRAEEMPTSATAIKPENSPTGCMHGAWPHHKYAAHVSP